MGRIAEVGMGAALAVTLAIAANGACRPGDKGEYVYSVPEQLEDGWTVSSLEEQGIDADAVTLATTRIIEGKYKGIHSMLIVRNGHLVHEAYFDGYDRKSLHRLYSVTKSISSGLIGIAIDAGFVKDVHEPVVALLPDYKDAVMDDRVEDITLEHVLTLTAGLEWDEKSYPCCDPRSSECQLMASDDWIEFVLGRRVTDTPGTKWVYNTGSVHVLSAVIKSTSGLPANEFAEKYLFEPLGITQYKWNTDPKGYQSTGGFKGGLRLRTRDLAKIGSLYLNRGTWHDKQVISNAWVQKSFDKHVTPFHHAGFGYLWWHGAFTIGDRRVDFRYAAGYGGQSVTLIPELDLMIVFTCWSRKEDADIFAPTLMTIKAAIEGSESRQGEVR